MAHWHLSLLKGNEMQFLDQAKIYVKSGVGGAGAVSFHRAKYLEFGGPDGGDGGRGGDVLIQAVENLNTLIDFRYQQHFKAATGGHGMGKNRHGAKGKDIIIKVPKGTQIYEEDKQTLIVDLIETSTVFCLAKGGNGGFGNSHFKSSTNQAPRQANPGQPCQQRAVWLKLKLIADIGIIGMPNAGKSTFLATVSRAKPKIADYPFTTLYPNLGVASYNTTEMILADVPGLIKGTHKGLGIGDRALKHIERATILLHLISPQENIIENYKIVRDEIEKYKTSEAKKFEIIVLSKIDTIDEKTQKLQQKKLQNETGKKIYLMSCFSKQGVNEILSLMAQQLDMNKKQTSEQENERWKPIE